MIELRINISVTAKTPTRDIKPRRSYACLRHIRCANPGFKGRDGVFQRPDKFQVFGRVGEIDHLLIIAQLQPIQAGADACVDSPVRTRRPVAKIGIRNNRRAQPECGTYNGKSDQKSP